ncbi:MAG: TIGR04255 family protein [Oscillospiraceae bacterium]|nr:TIGR04255 family protein [Oscillospiraceae bacterium]
MFSNEERVQYAKPQIMEVICQLRFPTILSIGAREPADFQDRIRGVFPRYSSTQEKPMKLVNGKMEPQPPVTNYQFLSADGKWKVNLTNSFLALATPAYTSWEDFANKLDAVLVHFIEIYKPAFFERIGLRYINAISRSALDLDETPFAELIQPGYLGLMADEDIQERAFAKIMQEAEVSLPGGCRLKIHCGPGMVKRNNVEDKEIKFILDNDVFMLGNIEMKHSAGALNTVHTNADRIFRGQITKTLHDAMEPL